MGRRQRLLEIERNPRLLLVLSCSLLCVALVDGSSTVFPGTLPAFHDERQRRTHQPADLPGSAGGFSSDDDDETDLESSSDFEESDAFIQPEVKDPILETNTTATTTTTTAAAATTTAAAAAAADTINEQPEIVSFDENPPQAAQVDIEPEESDSEEENMIQDELGATFEDDHVNEGLDDRDFQDIPDDGWANPTPTSEYQEEVETNEFEPTPPLRTLKKLQQMLDDTDYMTSARSRRVEPSRGQEHEAKRTEMPPQREKPRRPPPKPEAKRVEKPPQKEKPRPPPARVPPPPPSAGRSAAVQNEVAEVEPNTSTLSSKVSASDAVVSSDASKTEKGEKLWTSKDRSKYKKQQQMLRRAEEERRRLQQQLHSPPIHPNSSDDEAADSTDDGLGYTVPNLPVYFSDAEVSTDGTEPETEQPQQSQPEAVRQPPPPPFAQQPNPYQQFNPYGMPPPPQMMGQQTVPFMGYPPNAYMSYPPPYTAYTPQQQQIMAAQYASAWAAAGGGNVPYMNPYQRAVPPMMNWSRPKRITPPIRREPEERPQQAVEDVPNGALELPAVSYPVIQTAPANPSQPFVASPPETPTTTLTEAGTKLSFDSMQKLGVSVIGVALLCYCAVSPRNLPLIEYNRRFKENLRIVSLATIAPIVNLLFVFDAHQNDVNSMMNTFYTSFTVGYGFAFAFEIILTTVIRLGVFRLWEPHIFRLTPRVPSVVLPWTLRENNYRPKRITLFAADFITSCVAAPIIEEYFKLLVLRWSVNLPRNFSWHTKRSSKGMKRRVAEPITRGNDEPDVTNINSYVTHMLAASFGIKLADSFRRILMYTKESQANKSFYAICRGIFPIHELCGTMTALELAKKNVLGVNVPIWQMLFPAVLIHGMANFRGMKPIFKWNSATPWSEMQLSPLSMADDSTFTQLANKGFAKLMWLVILSRVLGYCIKNYYLISRQAVKRTTTYAGQRSAFSAELVATDVLKKTKDKKK